MNRTSFMNLSLVLATALAVTASPASAQQGKGKGAPERNAPSADRGVDRSDQEWNRQGNGSGKTPPGWCRGVGNPHREAANCGYGRAGRFSSYEDAHAAFHEYLDRKYSDLARRSPLNPAYQIRIRRDRKLEHDGWHAQMGRRHD